MRRREEKPRANEEQDGEEIRPANRGVHEDNKEEKEKEEERRRTRLVGDALRTIVFVLEITEKALVKKR